VIEAVQALALLLVAAAGTAVVLTRDPFRQAIQAGLFGLAMSILFFAVQAPDVALSQIAVGAVVMPAIILLALGKVRAREQGDEREEGREASRG
jgi:energy-converting hydrogenase B subunit D